MHISVQVFIRACEYSCVRVVRVYRCGSVRLCLRVSAYARVFAYKYIHVCASIRGHARMYLRVRACAFSIGYARA